MQERGVMGGIRRNEPEPPKPVPAPPPSPLAPPEPSLVLVQEDVHPGITVHVDCKDARPGPAELKVEGPQHDWRQHAKSASEGFNLPLTVAGKYRLTLRQPNDEGDWREQAHLTVEVPE